MKTAALTIPFDAEKLAALRQYAARKDIAIEAELTDALEKLYEKLVPAAVRDYLAQRPQPQPDRPSRPPRHRPRPTAAPPSAEDMAVEGHS